LSPETIDSIVAVFVGIGLSAACGFRVFVPMLATSILALTGQVHLSAGMQWIGTYPALVAFATATVIEIAAYYIPWLDHVLDIIASPAAVIAGTMITGAMILDVPPLLKWTMALIAGGAPAAIIQGATVLVRGKSALTTAGAGNFLVATGELLSSVLTSIFAVLLPIATGVVIIGGTLYLVTKFGKRVFGPRHSHTY
jgi:hypothetical protein